MTKRTPREQTKPTARRRPTAESDPWAYANRPDGPGDDPYELVRRHLSGRHIPPRRPEAQ